MGSQRGGLTGLSHPRCDIAEGCPQGFGDRVGALVEIDPEYRAAECSQRESAALGVEIDLLAVAPARGDHVGGLSHVPAEGANVLFGEDRLQRTPTGQPGIMFEREKACTEQVTHLVVGGLRSAELPVPTKNVAGRLW